MVRRGWSVAMAALVVLGAACSDDGDDAPPTTTVPPPPTLPESVDPGEGALLVDGRPAALTVVSCALEPVVDEATGVTMELSVVAEGDGLTVEVSRSSFPGDVLTVTDTVTVSDANGALEASRVDRDGLLLDLRVENPVGRLVEVDGTTVTAAGVFGAPGEVAAPTDVDGELVVRCP